MSGAIASVPRHLPRRQAHPASRNSLYEGKQSKTDNRSCSEIIAILDSSTELLEADRLSYLLGMTPIALGCRFAVQSRRKSTSYNYPTVALSHPCLVSAALALGAVARKPAPLTWIMDACARNPPLKLRLEIERAREPRLKFSPCRSLRIAVEACAAVAPTQMTITQSDTPGI